MTWETYSIIALGLLALWMGYRTYQDNRANEMAEDDENNPHGDASLLSRDGRK